MFLYDALTGFTHSLIHMRPFTCSHESNDFRSLGTISNSVITSPEIPTFVKQPTASFNTTTDEHTTNTNHDGERHPAYCRLHYTKR